MICIIGCGRTGRPAPACQGHRDQNVFTIDDDEHVNPHLVADITSYPIGGLLALRGTMEKVIFECLPQDVAAHENTWRNAAFLLEDGGILDVRTGNLNAAAIKGELDGRASIAFRTPVQGAYEETAYGLSIVWPYFRPT